MGDLEKDVLKEIFSSREALGVICYKKHRHQGKISAARISEILKVPINKVKDTCEKLQGAGLITTYKTGADIQIEFVDSENDKLKDIIDEAIWENKQEYGQVYKRLITAELLDFMGGGD
ncbi:MAG: hypothetical protein ACLFP1_07920 [Candidatus Goldiibacteriota bacterium]